MLKVVVPHCVVHVAQVADFSLERTLNVFFNQGSTSSLMDLTYIHGNMKENMSGQNKQEKLFHKNLHHIQNLIVYTFKVMKSTVNSNMGPYINYLRGRLARKPIFMVKPSLEVSDSIPGRDSVETNFFTLSPVWVFVVPFSYFVVRATM